MKTHPITAALVLLCGALCAGAAQYAGWAVGAANNGCGTILATTDSGVTWVRQGSGQVANVHLDGIQALDPMTAWVCGEADAGYATVYHTSDGGATWARKGFGQSALQNIDGAKLHCSGNILWVIGMNAILRSLDDGVTWTNCLPMAYTNRLLQGVFSCNDSNVWVGGEGSNALSATLLHSTDAGLTWTPQTILTANHILGISAANPQTLWAVGGEGFVVFRTDNAGDTWVKQPSQPGPSDANEVCAINTNVVWVAVDYFVELSTNGGVTWASATTPGYTMGVSAVDDREAWAVSTVNMSTSGAIRHTSDGGATWEPQGGDVPALWNVSFAREPVPEPAFIRHFLSFAVVIMCRLCRRH